MNISKKLLSVAGCDLSCKKITMIGDDLTNTAYFVSCRIDDAADITYDDTLVDILSGSELEYYSCVRAAKRKKDYLFGRAAAKIALGLLMPGCAAIIGTGVFKQPIVRGCDAAVSISHSVDCFSALAFMPEYPCAIDVECVDNRLGDYWQEFVDADELQLAADIGISMPAAYTILWSAKEAMSKATGTGLLTPLSVYKVSGLYTSNGMIYIQYANFKQFICRSYVNAEKVFSMVCPSVYSCIEVIDVYLKDTF